MSSDVRDVVIIGGGPAGTITAARLARERHDVTILEEHARIGSPVHCTGLLGWDAFEEFDLPRTLILGEAATACFWGAAGQSVTAGSQRARATVIDPAGPPPTTTTSRIRTSSPGFPTRRGT